MTRDVKLAWAAAAGVVVLVVALSTTGRPGNQQVDVSVPAAGADRALITVDMGAGELRLAGGASELLEGRFVYSVPGWRPDVAHRVHDGRAEVEVRQGSMRTTWWPGERNARNEWELRLAGDVLTELVMRLGAGRGEIDLGELLLARLDAELGAGDVTFDMRGPWRRSLEARIEGGVGRITLKLPRGAGVKVNVTKGVGTVRAIGLTRQGSAYVNEAFGTSPITLDVSVEAGVGEVVLEGEESPSI